MAVLSKLEVPEVVDKRMDAVRELVHTARVVGIRPLIRLWQAHRWGWQGILAGFYTTRTMQALFNVGFFDEVETRGSVNVARFAAERGLDEQILQALCDSLYALRILKRGGEGYVLDRKGKVLAETARGWFDISYGYEEMWHNLEGLLTKQKAYGEDFYRRSAYVARGSGDVEKWLYFPIAIDLIAQQGYRRVLDLGCGDGTFLRHVVRTRPDMTGYGVDIAPEAIEEGKRAAEAAGLQDRVHLFVHDINNVEGLPPALRDVQIATIFFILHELRHMGRDTVVEFLRNYRRLFPGVPLIVFEVNKPTPDERRKRPGMAVHYILYHELAHQKLVSRDEWTELFREAGFSSIEEKPLNFARTTIFTLRDDVAEARSPA
jgi:phenylpyruvate C(3)-methyltransferase